MQAAAIKSVLLVPIRDKTQLPLQKEVKDQVSVLYQIRKTHWQVDTKTLDLEARVTQAQTKDKEHMVGTLRLNLSSVKMLSQEVGQ